MRPTSSLPASREPFIADLGPFELPEEFENQNISPRRAVSLSDSHSEVPFWLAAWSASKGLLHSVWKCSNSMADGPRWTADGYTA